MKSSIYKLREKRIESQPLGPPKRGWLARDFWRGNLKRENNEKIRKEPATNVAYTTLVLILRATNGKKQWYTKNPRRAL